MGTEKRKILILGGGSFIGRHLHTRVGSQRADVTYRKATGLNDIIFDATKNSLSEKIDLRADYSHGIILFSETNVEHIAANPEMARLLNVDHTKRVIDQLIENDIVPVFASSDGVYGGAKGRYSESDSVNPIIEYGHQKRDVEQYLLATGCDWLTLRFAKIYGKEFGDGTLVTAMLSALLDGTLTKAANDYFFSPIFIDEVTKLIVQFCENGETGLYNVGGPDRVCHFDIAKYLENKLSPSKRPLLPVQGCSINEFIRHENRAGDVSMNSTKANKVLGSVVSSVFRVSDELILKGKQ